MATITPMPGKVFIRPIDQPNTTPAGIIIPDTVKIKPIMGTIIKIGKGKQNEKPSFQEGNTVFFNKHSAIPITYQDQPIIVVTWEDVIAIILQ